MYYNGGLVTGHMKFCAHWNGSIIQFLLAIGYLMFHGVASSVEMHRKMNTVCSVNDSNENARPMKWDRCTLCVAK